MRKSILCTSLLAVIHLHSIKAQRNSINEGENILSVQYTLLDINSIYYKNIAYQGANNLKVGGFNPIGVIYERVITKKFGLGAELSYGETNVSYSQKTAYSPNLSKTYTYQEKFSALAASIRMNFHFVNTKSFNAYTLLDAGYLRLKSEYSSNNPEYSNHTQENPIPIGLKVGIGLRYISDNMGIYTEIALNTQFIVLGISTKL
jgi:hypothetical protein